MKRQSVTAIIIAVLLVFSFFLIRSYRNINVAAAVDTNFLIGNWKLDSVTAPAQASDSIKQLVISLNSDDFRTVANFNFKADSAVAQFTPRDSLARHYVFRNDSVYIDNRIHHGVYSLQKISDSVISFRAVDSLAFFLRRK